jgi:hypothetical protein
MSRKSSLILLAVAVMLVVAIPATADLKIVQKTHTGGVMGQPAQDQNQIIYATSRWIRQEIGDKMILLFDGESGKMISLNIAKKEYSIIDPAKLKSMMDMAAGMMGEVKVSATPTQEVSKVGKWNAKLWKIKLTTNMFTMDMDIYATTDIQMPGVYDNFQKKWGLMQGPMAKLIEEMQKIKGYPVKSVGKMTIMGQAVDTTTEVIEVSSAKLADSLFQVPAGFKEVEFNIMSMQGM